MNESDCEECEWCWYDSLENVLLCSLYGEKPIENIDSCGAKMTYENELLIIEGNKEK